MILFSPVAPMYSDSFAFVFRPIRTQMSFAFADGEIPLNWATRVRKVISGVTFGCHASPSSAALFMAAGLTPPIPDRISPLAGLGSKTASSK